MEKGCPAACIFIGSQQVRSCSQDRWCLSNKDTFKKDRVKSKESPSRNNSVGLDRVRCFRSSAHDEGELFGRCDDGWTFSLHAWSCDIVDLPPWRPDTFTGSYRCSMIPGTAVHSRGRRAGTAPRYNLGTAPDVPIICGDSAVRLFQALSRACQARPAAVDQSAGHLACARSSGAHFSTGREAFSRPSVLERGRRQHAAAKRVSSGVQWVVP